MITPEYNRMARKATSQNAAMSIYSFAQWQMSLNGEVYF